MATRKNYATLSKVSYLAGADDRKIQKALRKEKLGNRMEYVPDLSDSTHLTFFDRKRDKAVVSYRGTQINNPADLFTDVAIFFGVERLTPRFNNALRAAKDAERRYGKDKVEYTGHSLGGTQALYVTNRTGKPCYAFNPGKGFRRYDVLHQYDALAGLAGAKKNKLRPDNATIYTTGIDPISLNSTRYDANVEYVKPSQFDVHGIDNFI